MMLVLIYLFVRLGPGGGCDFKRLGRLAAGIVFNDYFYLIAFRLGNGHADLSGRRFSVLFPDIDIFDAMVDGIT